MIGQAYQRMSIRLSSLFCIVLLTMLVEHTKQACYTYCSSCTIDNSPTDCTGCYSGYNRYLAGTQCFCLVGYIDNNNPTSWPTCYYSGCHYSCTNLCQGSSTNCTACPSGSYRYLSGSSCLCSPGYYESGSTTCSTCYVRCKTCSAYSTCTECLPSQYRYLSGSSCACLTGYFEGGNDYCDQCNYKCATCSSTSTNCGSCFDGTRSGTPSCGCIAKYYDDGYSGSCKPCHYSCQACTTFTSCTTCNGTKYRSYSQTTTLCACQDRYYDNNTSTQLCSSCHATCLACSGAASTNCVQCNNGAFRVMNPSTGACDCQSGYYATSATVQLCAQCDSTCLTCTSSGPSACSTCDSALYRYKSGTSCLCISGYYNSTANRCLPCDTSCATCTTNSSCATCPYTGQVVNSVTKLCTCPNTTVFNGTSLSCVSCHYSCTTCSQATTNCTSCDITTNKRVLSGNTCPCSTRYYNSGSAVCSSCSYTCLTCDSTGCLTCNTSAYRTKSGTSCNCMTGYYDDSSNQLCKACSSSCLTCSTSASNCLTCDGSTFHRTFSSNTCPCSAGYFDAGVTPAICQACSNKCATCTTNMTNCVTCAGSYRGSTPNCLCNNGYYDNGVAASCIACHYSCKTCINSSACQSCDLNTNKRTFSTSTTYCVCTVGYYDTGLSAVLCGTCSSTCLTCSSSAATACLTCDPALYRTFNSGTGRCDCMPNYYQNASTVCAPCHASCLTCTGTTSSTCVTCNSSNYRTISGSSCPCNTGYYNDANNVCQTCHASCLTCASATTCATCPSNTTQTIQNGICMCPNTTAWNGVSSTCTACDYSCATCFAITTNCSTCDNGTSHRLFVNNTCPCAQRYWNNGVAICAACHYSCLTCSAAGSSACVTCNSSAYRTKNSTTCMCNTGYYDDGSNQLCIACGLTCLTCSSGSSCATCDATTYHRTISAGSCICQSGYYDYQPTTTICQACSNKCATCTTSSTNCVTCAGTGTRGSTPNCLCNIGYFQDNINADCQPCHYSCKACTSGSFCTVCDATPHRTINTNTTLCGCMQRYFDDGVNVNCGTCHQTCLTCSAGLSTNCLTCNATAQRQINTATSACDCMPNYYATSVIVQLCTACHTSCLTCTGTASSNCLTCNSTQYRTFSTNSCPCFNKYYSDVNWVCLPCDPSCATCTNVTKCATCPSATQTIDSVTGVCQCPTPQIWDNSLLTCASCHYSCTTCTGITTNCTSCNFTTNKRLLSGFTCPCINKYYDNGGAVCLACSYTCMTCDNTGCTTCNNTAYRNKSSTSCVCQQGYYDDGTNQLCKICASTCQTCTLLSTKCTACDTTYQHRTLSGNTCVCSTGYYDVVATTSICQPCDNACLNCQGNQLNCTTCAGTGTRGAIPNCLCNTGYYDDGLSANCLACHYSCKTCTNASACTACDASKYRVINITTPYCICMDRHYDDGSSQTCGNCDNRCLTCDNWPGYDCLTCNASAHRVWNSGTGYCDCMPYFYQTSSTVQLCANCDPSCLTCNGVNFYNCLTCDNSALRTLYTANSSYKTCPCNTGYYSDTAYLCQACYPTCATCTNKTRCDTCPSNAIIDAVTGICQCPDRYQWDPNAINTCIICHYSCYTCSGVTTNCTTCNNASWHRVKVNTSCPCFDGYYDSGGSVCSTCNYRCLTCSSSSSSACLTCSAGQFRTLSGSTCPCNSGYYDDGNRICKLCQYSCQTCTSSSSCTSCNATLYRITNGTSNLCSCMTQYYQDPSSLLCKRCHYSCATCGAPNRCLTCNAAKFRVYNTSTTLCQAMNRYYDDGSNQLCQPCLYDCLTCNDASSCSSCDATTDHRQYNTATSRCSCINYYYNDTGYNPPICKLCQYSCLTCTGSAINNCLTCNASAYRLFDSTTYKCICMDGYYDDGSNQLCAKCNYKCATCITSATTCTSCDIGTSRTYSGNQCPCPVRKYYDNGINKYCLNCQYSCNTCTNNLACVSCNATQFRQFDTLNQYCTCMAGYYDDGYSNQMCLACPYQCTTCTNASVCATCDSANNHRHLPAQSCICMDGYYDTLLFNPICSACQYTCKTCMVANQCLTCNALKYRMYDANTHYCVCIPGYFDTLTSSQICAICHYTCTTCSSTATHCLTCNSSYYRQLNAAGSTCPCQQYYYDDLVNPLCQACHYTCLTCVDSITCSSCDPTKKRQADATTDKCKCMQRYFDNGGNSQMCATCQNTCLQCTNSSACTMCDSAALRLRNYTANYQGIISPYCVCIYKYYPQVNPQSICLPCHYTCAVCSGGAATNCLFCTADAHRTYNSTTNTCPCNTGYYDNGTSTQTCLTCHPYCTKCTDSTTTSCTQCTLPNYLKLDVTTCYSTCPSYFYGQNSTYTCQACSSHCITCINSTYCTSCDPGFPLYRAVCYTACPTQSTFTDAANNICIDCPAGCLTCTSSIHCNTCLTNYYLDTQLNLCFACNKACKGCLGPAQNQCTDCSYPLYLSANQCLNITCPFGQYVDSHSGCLNCSDLWSNSLTCTISAATLCQKLYKISNGVCVYCTSVAGYTITSTGDCSEICGDGIDLEYQCDDGNVLNGDGCSSNCLVEPGWHCSKNSNLTSICSIDGTVIMTLNRIYKYSGQNKVILYITLSIAIRLRKQNVIVSIAGLVSASSISWTLSQSQSDLSQVQLLLTYTQNINGKQISISYSQARRLLQQLSEQDRQIQQYNNKILQQSNTFLQQSNIRLLQSTSFNFSTTFTIDSYPPAVYYPQQTISLYQRMRYTLYIGCIILLILCGLNFVFLRKMYIHIFPFACIPAQLYIYYGIASQTYTDWIKYCLYKLSTVAFIGGFKAGTGSTTTTEYLNYSYEITQNMGIVMCIMLALWVSYGIMAIFKKYLCNYSVALAKFMMYARYFTVTLQFCLFPHMAYSAVNALYHSSLNTQTQSINVCLAIFINVYLLGLIAAFFVLSKAATPHPMMIEAQQVQKDLSVQDNVSENDSNNDDNSEDSENKLKKNKNNESNQRMKDMNQTKQILFVNPDAQDQIVEDGATQKADSDRQSAFYSRDSRRRIKPKNSQQKKEQKDKNINKNINEQDENVQYVQYNGVQYFHNNLATYKKVEQGYVDEWLIYDYNQLYATGGLKANPNALPYGMPEVPYKSNELILRKFTNTKYYLPITLLRLYILSLATSVAQSYIFVLYAVLGGISLAYFLFVLFVRPFKFGFSNFRILFIEFCFMVMDGFMAYYAYQANKNAAYYDKVQMAVLGAMIATVMSSIVLLLIESVGAWRMEIWNKLQPWLVAMRLRGARKVMKYKKYKPKIKSIDKPLMERKQEEKDQEMDAFFARMLKKQAIQRQYRKERLMKNPKIVLR